MINYPRIWIVFQNDMILRVYSNAQSAKNYRDSRSQEEIDSAAGIPGFRLSRFWIDEQPVFDKFEHPKDMREG